MDKKDTIKGASRLLGELCTPVVTGGKKYHVLTEENEKKHLIVTRIYLGGEIIKTKEISYKNVLNTPEPEKKIRELVNKQHELVVKKLRGEEKKEKKTPSYYLDEVKNMLMRNNEKGALKLLIVALEQYPREPFLLSYYGCLEAIVNKEYTHGIATCLKAIKILDDKMAFGHEFFYPLFYLNLGRAYIAAGNKKNALEAFQTGLTFNEENKDLLWEVRKLGIRKRLAISFLPRSNPINKYIGLLLHKFSPSRRKKK